MTRKILLINSLTLSSKGIYKELKYPPMGIMFLGAVLRRHNYEPYVFDSDIELHAFEKLEKMIKDNNFTVVGISFSSMTSKGAFAIAKKIKEINPEIKVIAGGYHPTVMIKETLSDPNFDFLVYGEGEDTLPELLEYIHNRGNENKKLEDIKGLAFKKKGEIVINPPRPFIKNLDSIPLPTYDLISIGSYSNPSSTRKPYITYIRSRGCPFFCNFCGVQKMFSRGYRCESPQKTVENIDYLVKKFNIKEILFKDSEFVINKENVMEFCDLLAGRKYDLIWGCNARVDTISEELLRKMKDAGCSQITYGIESGNEEILKKIGKNIKLDDARRAIKLTKKIGIKCVTNFILGHAGETEKTINETIDFAKELNADYTVFGSLMAFPGSEIYNEAIANNWFINGRPKLFTYESLRLNATNIDSDKLTRFMKKALFSFYFRPSYILKRLIKSVTSLAETKNNFIGLWFVLKKVLVR